MHKLWWPGESVLPAGGSTTDWSALENRPQTHANPSPWTTPPISLCNGNSPLHFRALADPAEVPRCLDDVTNLFGGCFPVRAAQVPHLIRIKHSPKRSTWFPWGRRPESAAAWWVWGFFAASAAEPGARWLRSSPLPVCSIRSTASPSLYFSKLKATPGSLPTLLHSSHSSVLLPACAPWCRPALCLLTAVGEDLP